MHPLIEHNRTHIQALCRKYQISRLWLFGSALDERFNRDSDIDLLYELDHDGLTGREHLDYFFGFADAMKDLLGREIDLVWYAGIRNPYFKEELDETKVLLHEQERNAPGLIRQQFRVIGQGL